MELVTRFTSAFLHALYMLPAFLFEMAFYQFGTIAEGNIVGGLVGGIFALLLALGCVSSYCMFIAVAFIAIRDKVYPLEKRNKRKKEKEFAANRARDTPILDELLPHVELALQQQRQLLDLSSGYLMRKDWIAKLDESKGLFDRLNRISSESVSAHSQASVFKEFIGNSEDLSILPKRNQAFKEREIESCRSIFDDINGMALDKQQAEAVVTDEYNNLVIAGAGSGKTLTVVGKIKYLTERLGIAPEEILLTSFTRKSVDELKRRVELAGITGVSCKTFHAIGLSQLPGMGVANENELSISAAAYLREGIRSHPGQTRAYLEFYGCYKHVPKDYADYDNAGDRYQELKASDLVTLRGKLDTLKGERVKSEEELMIANFLFLSGVEYEYEKNYSGEYDTQGRAYQPDFYLPEYDIWFEHFGINENGRLPWIGNPIKEQEYIDGMRWKREIHKANGTRLIESYSYWNKDQDLINKVTELLVKNGVELSQDPERLATIYEGLSSDDRYLRSIIKLVTTFLSLAKANKITMAEIWERARASYAGKGYMWHRFELFMAFTEPIMESYQNALKEKGQIDYDDMINLATDSIRENGMVETYKYIIVDEYQDISKSRFELIQAIREQHGAKLMCVGDDWQSIYRFAGSDVSLFTRFEDYVGYAERLKIEKTYRNSQQLVDIASEFIEKNPSQVHKKMISKARPLQTPLTINQIDDAAASFERALDSIIGSKANYDGEILVLGRHNMDIERIYPALHGDENISFRREKGTGDIRIKYKGYDRIRYLSVHKAKGLEADDVVVLNLISSMYGFPNRLEDDPILQILLGESEGYEFAEERRLFYVAITRTKHTVTLISCGSSGTKDPSPFVRELKEGCNSTHISICKPASAPDEWDPTLCPGCGSGRLVVRTNQSTGEQFLGCTNYPYCNETYAQLEILSDRVRCPFCGDWMVRRNRKSDGAPFFGCSNYPRCRASYDVDDDYRPIDKKTEKAYLRPTGSSSPNERRRCPKCGGALVVRTNKKDGSKFYGCSSFPKCRYTRNI